MTNNYRICHVLTPSETNTRFICHVLTPSRMNFKSAVIFFKKFKKTICFLLVFASPIFRGEGIIKGLLNSAFAGYQNYSDLGQRYLPQLRFDR